MTYQHNKDGYFPVLDFAEHTIIPTRYRHSPENVLPLSGAPMLRGSSSLDARSRMNRATRVAVLRSRRERDLAASGVNSIRQAKAALHFL